MTGSLDGVARRFVVVDGIKTHYLEAGDGPTVVLLHSGEFGAAAEISWEYNIGPLSEHFRVIALDFLGFGHTAKLADFGTPGGMGLRIAHFRRFLEVLAIERADFAGVSMGASILLRLTALGVPLPVRRQVAISGGGVIPSTPARDDVTNYDCTTEGMRRLIRALLVNPRFAADDAYVQKRYEMSLVPGAWQCSAMGELRPPGSEAAGPPPAASGDIPYENIRVPTFVVAGAQDKIRALEHMETVHRRTPGSRFQVFPESGHASNIDQADEFNAAVIEFLLAPDED